MLRLAINALPIGTVWRLDSMRDETIGVTVEVIGYVKPEAADRLTIPPLTEEQISQIDPFDMA
jgi:hypothetical protein